jgi:hypothetical protein
MPIKALLANQGQINEVLRLPMTAVTGAHKIKLIR